MPKKIMNEEIKKYFGRIYYLDMRKDCYGNQLAPRIERAFWIESTNDYDHFSFELHHLIKFTHYENNIQYYKNLGLTNCLILIPKILHQHLENPVYSLTDDEFYNKYKINRYELLFSKKDFEQGKYPFVLAKPAEEMMSA